jgi:SAM-dependent methyltransferase
MLTVISRAGVRKTLHMPSSSLSREAASSKRAAAASQGFFSFSCEMDVGDVNVATDQASGFIMAATGGAMVIFMPDLLQEFGPIDIYLFDQMLRGQIRPGMRIFDAGCGSGRNLVWLLRQGFEVFGVDADERAVDEVRRLASSLSPRLPKENFRAERLESLSFPEAFADVVLSSAVLHFARDDQHFEAMLRGTWRILKPGGLFFCRLASTIGIEKLVQPRGGRRFHLPDGSDRYLVDAPLLLAFTEELGGQLVDPIKTTVVHNQRSMTTWVVRKTTQ